MGAGSVVGRERGQLLPVVVLAQVALGQRDEIAIYGDDWPTPDGTCVRDYIHVDDLAEAHVLALDLLSRGDAGSLDEAGGHLVCNLGNGQGFSVLEGAPLNVGYSDVVRALRWVQEEIAHFGGDPGLWVDEWSQTGIGHHWALCVGHRAADVKAAASLLGVEHRHVTL